MLRPENLDLEALLVVCTVQPGLEVFAYRSKVIFLARCSPGIDRLNSRCRKLFPAAMRRFLYIGVLTRGASCRYGAGGWCCLKLSLMAVLPALLAVPIPKLTIAQGTVARRSGLQKVRTVRDCCTGAKCRRDVNRFR